MCGIAGAIGRDATEARVKSMMDMQVHRGPDGEGLWRCALQDRRNLVLGHRRLSILDLSSAGAQPMLDATGRFALTYNGEIYNYIEVRRDLEQRGVVFRSHSDTEVVLEAYKAWGSACLDRFNGMFAFALYDSNRSNLFCARDRYGEKPFLFSFRGDLFVFASEYKALLQNREIPLDIDERRLVRAAHNPGTGLDADRETVFCAVQQLRPGEAMEIDVYTLEHTIWRYWQVRPGPALVSNEGEIFEAFRDLLIDAVRLRMRSDVPVGSCLSGGLDSSAIVCIARHLLGADAEYHTFTGRFPGNAADEWAYASVVADAAHVHAHVVEPGVERFLEDLPSFFWFNELPVGSSSQYAQWSVFRLAKEQGVTVLLDGQGADEALGGYEQYFARYVAALLHAGDDERLERELPAIRARYPLALAPPARVLRDRLPFGLRHALSGYLGAGTNLLYGIRREAATRIGRENAMPELEGFNPLTGALVQDSFGRFLTTLLRYGDRNSMAHSREVRLPFCDHRIAEFVARLPPHLLMGEIQTKRLLRESMRGILPEKIRTRWNKQGFLPPQATWFKSPALLELADDVFARRSFAESSYWNAPWWRHALARLRAGETALHAPIWSAMTAELWQEMFLSRIGAMRRAATVKP